MSYQLVNLTNLLIPNIRKFVTEVFSKSEPMLMHLNSTSEDFAGMIDPAFKICQASGLSYAFLKGEELAGIFLNSPKLQIPYCFTDKISKLIPIIALLDQLESQYQIQKPQKALTILISSTDPKHAGNKFFEHMVKQLIIEAPKKGYNELIIDCTSSITDKVVRKFGFEEMGRINYDSFQFENGYPFKGIGFSVTLMRKKVNLL